MKDLGVAAQGGHALLDAGAPGVVQANHRRAHPHGLVHHLANFLRMGLRQGAAKHGEVLAVHEHQPAVDAAVAGDDTIAGDLLIGHAEVAVAVLDELVPFLEATFIEHQADALPGGQLALGMLLLNTTLATA